uniref:Protein kinase domain-containing protein n=1 Tax=Acrobeloides nanus TaxID=290746 RepID=A0A914E8K1_9BILA
MAYHGPCLSEPTNGTCPIGSPTNISFEVICNTRRRNCHIKRFIEISGVGLKDYGILVCAFYEHYKKVDNYTWYSYFNHAQLIEVPISMRITAAGAQDEYEMRTLFGYGSVLLILIGLLFITMIQKSRQRKPLAANMLQFIKADEWELNEIDVAINYAHRLGIGSTAEVYKGELSSDFKTPANGPVVLDEKHQAAVKILKKNITEMSKNEFFAEIEIYKRIGRHPRLVNLIGVMQLRRPPLIVIEYCAKGDLRRFLASCRQYANELMKREYNLHEMDDIHSIPKVNEDLILSLKRALRLALQICLGMEYLATQQIIHNDIASRNIFLTEKSSLKIGDFGLSSREENPTKISFSFLKDFRLRWLAPEVLQQEGSSLKSDMWSFGVVLYELLTLGGVPYTSCNNIQDLLDLLKSGERAQKPQFCPEKLFPIIQDCWQWEPSARPDCHDVTSFLTEFYDSVDNKDDDDDIHVTNFYLQPDPNNEIYSLPITRKTSASPVTRLKSNDGSSRPSSKTVNFENKPPTDLIDETKRLLGFL